MKDTPPRRDPLTEVDWPIATDRLTLRRATPDDAADDMHDGSFVGRKDFTTVGSSHDRVSEWITTAPETFEQYTEYFCAPDRLAMTLIIERSGQVIGDLMLRVDDAWSQREARPAARGVQAELGWVLHPDHRGQGYATEAVRAAVEVCFGPLGLRRVVAGCFADNTASWQLMERIGLRRESHAIRDGLHRSGRWLDGLTYALLREEWLDR